MTSIRRAKTGLAAQHTRDRLFGAQEIQVTLTGGPASLAFLSRLLGLSKRHTHRAAQGLVADGKFERRPGTDLYWPVTEETAGQNATMNYHSPGGDVIVEGGYESE